VAPTASRRHLTAIGVLTAVAAVATLIWQMRGSDPREILDEILTGIYSVRWGFPLILALGGLRFALRAYVWGLCVEPPARLKFRDAFAAILAADAIGNVTALGPIVSEPAKIAFVRGRVDVGAAITALAVETLFYSMSVAAMIGAGIIALLFSFEVEAGVRYRSEIALGIIAALLAAACWVLWRRPALVSRALGAFTREGSPSSSRLERVQVVERDIYSFASRRTSVLAPLIASEIGFHVLGVLEMYVALMYILPAPSLLLAFILEAANRLITVLFKFVPMRTGVDEAGTGSLTQILGYGVGLGVTIALVRKGRMIVWSLIGGALLVRRGLSARRILEESEVDSESQSRH
jgi:hypothetical protein